jgi:hypothetical protein
VYVKLTAKSVEYLTGLETGGKKPAVCRERQNEIELKEKGEVCIHNPEISERSEGS